MDTFLNPNLAESSPSSLTPRLSFWRRLGGGPLTFAILVHGVVLIVGGIWIFQVIREPEKKDDFVSSGGGGGGGERSANAQVQQKKRAQITPATNVKRVFAEGAQSSYAIPDPGDNFGQMSVLSSATGGGLGGGFGGAGNGRGFGKGDGVGAGMAGTGNGKFNPFGMVDPNANALVGTFYDLKQSRHRKPTGMAGDAEKSNELMREKVREFVRRGFNEQIVKEYYQASQQLYQTKIHMPSMDADAAPAAFNCQNEVQPRRWLVVYRGEVKAPLTGKFRFVGGGDDFLVVRFNRRLVFDHGYTLATSGKHVYRADGIWNALAGRGGDKDFLREFKKTSPMEVPIAFHQYPNCQHVNDEIAGFAVGPVVEVREGQTYPIEILLGEIPGGRFSAELFIKEEGVTYPLAPTGAPILPLFRTDGSLPSASLPGEAPPFAPSGPVFRVVRSGGGADI